MMKVFAHRGASGNHPENTLSAFRRALEIGVCGIEVDVQSCLDDYVIIHDAWLDRTTNGTGRVSDSSLKAIKSLDAGLGQQVPTLDDFIKCTQNQVILNLELKNTFHLDVLVNKLLAAVDAQLVSQENLLVSSFNHHHLKEIKQQLPWVKIGALTSSLPLGYAQFASELDAYSVHVDKDFVNAEFVADAHQRGLAIYAYTVDKYDDVKRMYQLGIDGIFSNFPSKTKSFIELTNLNNTKHG